MRHVHLSPLQLSRQRLDRRLHHGVRTDGDLPKPRVGHSSTACQLTDGSPALILFGGFDGDEVCDDTLIFVASEERWLPVDVGGNGLPAPRAMHAAAMLGRHTLIVHGGWGGSDVMRSDTSALGLSSWEWDAPCTRLAHGSHEPSARQGHTLVAAAPDELLLYGGDIGRAVPDVRAVEIVTPFAQLREHLLCAVRLELVDSARALQAARRCHILRKRRRRR